MEGAESFFLCVQMECERLLQVSTGMTGGIEDISPQLAGATAAMSVIAASSVRTIPHSFPYCAHLFGGGDHFIRASSRERRECWGSPRPPAALVRPPNEFR